jgi:hypothetical protein
MRKQVCVKKILLYILLCLCSFNVANQKIQAVEQPKIKTNVYMKEGHIKIPSTKDISEVPIGSTLTMEMNITGITTSTMKLVNPKGYTYLLYYPGIMKINNVDVTNEQYQQLYNKGITISNTTLILDVQYTGLEDGVFLMQPMLSFSDGTSYTQGYELKSLDKDIQQGYIQFFDPKGTLLLKEEVNANIEVPIYENIGYTFLGFNTRKDGSGTYFQDTKVNQAINYYAIIKPITYNVSYYVNNKLFKTNTITFNSKVEPITAPYIKDMSFIKWVGLVDNITEDINIYALYQKEDTTYLLGDTPIENTNNIIKTLEIIDQEQQSTNEVETNKTYILEIDEQGNTTIVNNKQKTSSNFFSNTNAIPYILAFLIFIFLLFLFIKKILTKNKQDTSNF